MKTNNSYNKVLACLFAGCVLFLAPAAFAANGNDTWQGNTDGNWATGANWSPAVNAPPIGGDWLFFGTAGSSGASLTNNLGNGTNFAGITFNSGTSAYTFVGNPIVLGGGITNSSTSLETISFPMTITNNQTMMTTPGGGNVTLNGGVSGAGGALTLIGGGTLTLGGTNNYSSTTTINAGKLTFSGNNVMPAYGTIVPNNAGTIIDLAGTSQTVGPVQSSASNGSGVVITNSSAGQSVLTINTTTSTGGTVNDFQYNSGLFGGNLKVVLVGNGITANYGGANAFQFSVAGSSIPGGLTLQGFGTTALTTANLLGAGGYIISGAGSCTNTSSIRINSGVAIATPQITLDNGMIWTTAANNVTNPISVTARGGILRVENTASAYSGSISGSGFLGLDDSTTGAFPLSDLSGFTGTLGVDCGGGNGVSTVNINSNSPASSCNLLFWGNAGKTGILQWNGSTASPVTLTFAEVSSTSVAGSSTAIGRLSSGVAATVTYQLGDNTATTNTFGGIVQNGSGAVGVTKIGSDTQILSGANSYTNPTYVGGGTLVLSGVNNGGGGCVVSNGATLGFGGTGSLTNTTATVTVQAGGTLAGGGASIGGLVTLNSGNAAINLQDSIINTLTLAGGLTLNNGNVLSFDLGGSADSIAITGGAYTKNAGTVTVNVTGTGFSAGTYNLITGASIGSTNGFVLGAAPSNPSFAYALVASSGNLALQVTVAVSSPANAYWKGGVDNNWSTADSGPIFNWATTSAGTTSTGAKPGVTTAVAFSASGAANQSTVLGGNFEISSLVVNSAANVGIGGANTLQVDSGGLTVTGSGNLTISNSSLVLGGAQLWTNNSANTVTVSAPISGLSSLTLGGGNTVFSGANSHGGTTVAGGGKLTLSGSGTLGSGSATVTANGSTIDLGSSSQSVGAVSLVNASAITNGTISGTSYDLESGTISAVMGGSLAAAATKNTAGTVTLTANNTFSGNMVISNGTLQIGAGGNTGSLNPANMSISNGAAVVFYSSVSQTNNTLISGPGPISILGGASLRLLNVSSSFSGNVTVDGSGSALISGSPANTANAVVGVLGNPSVARTFTLTNSGVLSLLGGNTFGGFSSTRCGVVTYINPGSQLVLNANDDNILGDLHFNGGAMLVGNGFSVSNQAAILAGTNYVVGTNASMIISTGTDATKDGIQLGIIGTDANSAPANLCVKFIVSSTGAGSADLTVSAPLVDPPWSASIGGPNTSDGGIFKDGAGTMLLTAANTYTGPTLVYAGKLVVSSAQGANGMTNYVDVYNGAALGILVSGTNQWSPSLAYLAPDGTPMTLEFNGLINTNITPFNPASIYSTVGPVTVNINGPLSVGTYRLIGNAASYISSFSLGTLPLGAAATLVADTDGTTIDLNVTTASAPYVWTGLNNTNWDTTTANNWKANGTATVYQDAEPVQFDDSATRTSVTVVGTVSPASMIVSNSSKVYTFAGGSIGGLATLTKNGNGTLILDNTNTYAGGTVISNGTVQLGDGIVNNGVVAGNVTDNGQLAFANPTAQTFSGVISGTGSLFKNASGTLTLTASNIYSGGTTLASGTVLLPGGGTSPFGSGSLTISNNTILIVQPNSTTLPVLLEHNVVVPSGVSTLIDDSANPYGNVWIGSDTAQWNGSGTVNFQNNGANLWTAVLWSDNPFTNFSGTINVGSTNSANGMFNGFGYNGYAGAFSSPTTVDASGVAWKLGDVGFTRTFAVNSCTLVKMGSISANNPATEIQGNGSAPCTYEVGALNSSTTFAGFIDNGSVNPVSLTKVGSSTLTLTGTNSYTGNTTVKAGTLELAQAFATLATNSTVSISNGAALKLTVSGVTNQIAGLVLNGVVAANGLYGSANSSGFITGLGYLQVGTVIGPSGPEILTNSYNVGTHTLSLSWPVGENWKLQMQTNSLSKGLGTNWVYITDGSVNSTNITVDPTKPTVFYRLTYP